MTDKEERMEKDYKNGNCPVCGSRNLEELYFFEDESEVIREVYCPACDRVFRAKYTLVSVTEIEP